MIGGTLSEPPTAIAIRAAASVAADGANAPRSAPAPKTRRPAVRTRLQPKTPATFPAGLCDRMLTRRYEDVEPPTGERPLEVLEAAADPMRSRCLRDSRSRQEQCARRGGGECER